MAAPKGSISGYFECDKKGSQAADRISWRTGSFLAEWSLDGTGGPDAFSKRVSVWLHLPINPPSSLRPSPRLAVPQPREDANTSGMSSSKPSPRVFAQVLHSAQDPMPHISRVGQLLCLGRLNWIISSAIESSLIQSTQSVPASLVPLFSLVQAFFIHALTHLAFFSTNTTSINMPHMYSPCKGWHAWLWIIYWEKCLYEYAYPVLYNLGPLINIHK